MFKNVVAVLALAFVAVNAQNTTLAAGANSTTGNATSGSWCRATSDCAANLCCGATKTGAVNYVQFNCVASTRNATSGFLNANSSAYQCIQANQTYTTVCAAEERVCTSSDSLYTICGGKIATGTIDLFNSKLTCSNAFTLVSSALFAVIASLALVF
jgi:hypothetical protein